MKPKILADSGDRESCDLQKCLISQSPASNGSKSCKEAFSPLLNSHHRSCAHSVSLSRRMCLSGTPRERIHPPRQLCSHSPLTMREDVPINLSLPADTSARQVTPRDVPGKCNPSFSCWHLPGCSWDYD